MTQNAVSQEEIALMAHLLRRAGFGASRDEIEARAQQGYDSVVEELLNPADDPGIDEDLMYRAYPSYFDKAAIETGQTEIVYRMINNKHQLKEKMALFWHTILCAGDNKVDNARTTSMQYDTFREKGMGNFKELLLWLSTDPAMLYYLDNIESHKTAVNENYGRELLELFSLGVGMDQEFNYTEDDVKACARAFPAGTWPRRSRSSPMAAPPSSSASTPPTTTTAKRPSWAKPATGTEMKSLTSSASSPLPPGSWPASSTTSSSPTNRPFPPGA